ncbi:MAG: TVP38/TMEM64 family protein [Aestuariivirgaceae bacterium]
MTEPSADTTEKKSSPLRRWGPLALLLAGIVAAYASGAHNYLSLGAIAENRDSLQQYVEQNAILAIGGYILIYVLTVAFSLPGAALLTILGGFLFGPIVGGISTVTAATIGATAIFMIAKTSIGDALVRKAGPWVKALADGFKEDAFNYLLFLRLVPLFPFWLVNIAPALFNVRLSTFAIGTFLGIIPGTFAFSIVGSGLDSIIDAQKTVNQDCIATKGAEQCPFTLDAGALITPKLIAGFVALGIVALIPVILKRLKARKKASA